MKRLRTWLYVLLTCVLIPFSLVSCGNDDDGDTDSAGLGPLVGTWEYQDPLKELMPEGGGMFESSDVLVVIKSDGTYYGINAWYYKGGGRDLEIEKGQCSVDGNKMTVNISGTSHTSTFSISGKTLTASANGMKVQYVKVPDSRSQAYIEEYESKKR